MQKRDRKLQLHRETLRQLDARHLTAEDLVKARGGIDWTGCMSECTECGTIAAQRDA
ncbi:MAG TPA: hypothetical protein VKM72_12450 [Thermoanaerobaculia bacterium]|nr:hypothetical protein [Thermoanaerobaculia bacterium]